MSLASSGERGIRTPGTHKEYNSFRDCPVRPLRHLSIQGTKLKKLSQKKFFFVCSIHFFYIFAASKFRYEIAEVAQLVEHNLAKVRVASSSLVFRSDPDRLSGFLVGKPWWWNGRHAGLKIPWAVMSVRVQVPPEVQKSQSFVGQWLRNCGLSYCLTAKWS